MKLERLVRKALRLAAAVAVLAALGSLLGCAAVGKGTPKGRLIKLNITASSNLNNCGRAVPLVLHYRMIQVTDAAPLAGMKLGLLYGQEREMLDGALLWAGMDLAIEPGATRQDPPVAIDPRARAVVVIGNFCKTKESCFYFAQPIPEKVKKDILLDLTADSTCIGPTRH
jgi:type VI secretion system VasD/TssJ family lipoprotein